MKVSFVVAMDKNNGIGVHNELPWHLGADMAFFKGTTMRHIVLMGRKNYDSIPERFRPLANRLNIVLTRNKDFQAPDCLILHSVEEAVQWKKDHDDDPRVLYIIGGAQIFNQFMALENFVDEMLITKVDVALEVDTHFPNFNEHEWQRELLFSHEKDEKNDYSFSTWRYERNGY